MMSVHVNKIIYILVTCDQVLDPLAFLQRHQSQYTQSSLIVYPRISFVTCLWTNLSFWVSSLVKGLHTGDAYWSLANSLVPRLSWLQGYLANTLAPLVVLWIFPHTFLVLATASSMWLLQLSLVEMMTPRCLCFSRTESFWPLSMM